MLRVGAMLSARAPPLWRQPAHTGDRRPSSSCNSPHRGASAAWTSASSVCCGASTLYRGYAANCDCRLSDLVGAHLLKLDPRRAKASRSPGRCLAAREVAQFAFGWGNLAGPRDGDPNSDDALVISFCRAAAREWPASELRRAGPAPGRRETSLQRNPRTRRLRAFKIGGQQIA